MRRDKLSAAIGNINEKYVNEATAYTGAARTDRHTGWGKWGIAAACLVLAAALGIGIFKSGLFFDGVQIAVLEDGSKIDFARSASAMGSLDLAFEIETRDLTEGERQTLFKALPVTGYAVFNAGDDRIIGFEGEISGIKLIISFPDVTITDTVIEGEEGVSEVDGVSVNAGYFTSGSNVIYYAAFALGESTVYVEHAGPKDRSETVKNELSAVIQKLIALGEIDLYQIPR